MDRHRTIESFIVPSGAHARYHVGYTKQILTVTGAKVFLLIRLISLALTIFAVLWFLRRRRKITPHQSDDNPRNTDLRSMSRAEAYQVLGLQPGASETEIIRAHRRIVQKVHPDRGGSDYLAARVNRAKDILLG